MANKKIKKDSNVLDSSFKKGVSGLRLGNCEESPALSKNCTPERRQRDLKCVGCWMK